MLLLPFKILFLVGVVGFWYRTGNGKIAAGAWAFASFLINAFAFGLSATAVYLGITSFLVGWCVFLILTCLQRSILMIPAGVTGVAILLVLS